MELRFSSFASLFFVFGNCSLLPTEKIAPYIDPVLIEQLFSESASTNDYAGNSSLTKEQKNADPETSPAVVQFMNDCKRYVLEPGWIMQQLLTMNVDEFCMAWQWFSTTLFITQKVTQKKRSLIILHCKEFDTFFNNLVINADKTIAITSQKSFDTRSLFQYWEKKQQASYTHFYAFYFDCVAADFIETINNAFLDGIENADGKKLYKEATQQLMNLFSIFKRLEKTEYDEGYSYHLKRYCELIQQLTKEAIAAEAYS